MKFQRQFTVPWSFASLVLVSLITMPCYAQDVAHISSAVAFSSKGTVTSGFTTPATRTTTGSKASTVKAVVAQPAAIDPVQPGGKLTTGADGATSLILGNTGTARMGADTEIQLPDAKTKDCSLEMLKGKLFLNISAEELAKRKTGEFRLKTPAALLAVKGTKFFAISTNGTDTIGVHEGSVSVTEPASKATVTVPAGQAVSISAGQISSLREITDEERGYKTEFDVSNLVRTPLALILEQYPSASSFEKQKPALRKIINQGVLVELSDHALKRVKGATYMESIELRTGAKLPIISTDGVLSYTENYIRTIDRPNAPSSNRVYNILFDLYSYIKTPSPVVVALQFRMRCKNVSGVTLKISDKHKDGSPTVTASPTLTSDGSWNECTVVVGNLKSFDELSHHVNFTIDPSGPKTKNSPPRRDTYYVELSDFFILTTP